MEDGKLSQYPDKGFYQNQFPYRKRFNRIIREAVEFLLSTRRTKEDVPSVKRSCSPAQESGFHGSACSV